MWVEAVFCSCRKTSLSVMIIASSVRGEPGFVHAPAGLYRLRARGVKRDATAMNVDERSAGTAGVHSVSGTSAIELDLDRDGETLLVLFSGFQQGLGMPVLEFKRITRSVNAKLVFLRDPLQSWYHGRLPDVGNGPLEVSAALTRLQAQSGCRRLVCIGNSMGGYGALLVGSLARADHVVAFSPQTFISRWPRLRHWDRRWRGRIRDARRSDRAVRGAFDLAAFLRPPEYGHADIYADAGHRLDALHADRLRCVERTTIHAIAGGHGAIRQLRDSGTLLSIIRAAAG